MKKKRYIVYLLMFVLSITLIACNSENKEITDVDNDKEVESSDKGKTLSIASLGAGSSGYNQTSALAEGLSKGGYQVRVIPTGNGLNRVTQLKEGSVKYFVGYDEVYLSLEGMAEYAITKVGPVQLRTILGNTMGVTMVASEESGIKTLKDLKGKRVGYVPGDSSVGYKTSGLLAFAGYTWEDVVPVPYPAWVESVKGILAGGSDTAQQALPPSSVIYELAASPKGVSYPIFAHDDKEAWDRLWEWAPWMFPETINASDLVGLDGDEELEFTGFISPSFVTLASTSDEEVYELVKTLDENYDVYKDALPEMEGWSLEKAGTPPLSAPVHTGVVKYLKEKGIWTDEHEEWNNEKIERSEKLEEIWDQAIEGAQKEGIKDEEFEEYWMSIKEKEIGGFCKILPGFLKGE